MLLPISAIVALFYFLHPVAALQNDDFPPAINVATSISANTPVEASIPDTDLYNGDTSLVDSLKIYLASAATDSRVSFGADSFAAQCTLIKSIPICNPSITVASTHVAIANLSFPVSIPSPVGPSGQGYALHARLFQTDGASYGAEVSSNAFSLTGGTGNWSKTQLADYALWTADAFPCSSFACVKGCSDRTYGDRSVDAAYRACVGTCPDVDMNYFNATRLPVTTATGTAVPTPTACLVSQTSSASTSRSRGATATATTSRPMAASAAALIQGAPSLRTLTTLLLFAWLGSISLAR